MTDAITPTIRLTEPTPGGDTGTWGTLLNSDLVYTDQATNQSITVSVPDTNVTLIADGSAADQARYLRYNFTGALTANRTITLPPNEKFGWATNATTGAFNIILSAGGTTMAVGPGVTMYFRCDGSSVFPILPTWQQTSSLSLSNVSSVVFPLSSAFRRFRCTLQGASVLTSSTELGIQFSPNGGASYINTAYAWCLTLSLTNLTTSVFGTLNSNQIIFVGPSIGNISGIGAVIEIYPGSATTRPTASASGIMYPDVTSGGQLANASVTGQWVGGTGTMNFARIITTNGNFSGTVILEGLP